MRSFLIILLVAIIPNFAMAEEIFLESQNPVSGRHAVFDDNGKVAFLYLTEVGVPKPVRDAIAYTRVPPIDKVDWDKIRKSGDTPLLPRSLATPNSLIKDPKETEFQFKWSKNGDAVAILRNGQPLAFATVKERFGFSHAVRSNSPLANAWNQALYISLFTQ